MDGVAYIANLRDGNISAPVGTVDVNAWWNYPQTGVLTLQVKSRDGAVRIYMNPAAAIEVAQMIQKAVTNGG